MRIADSPKRSNNLTREEVKALRGKIYVNRGLICPYVDVEIFNGFLDDLGSSIRESDKPVRLGKNFNTKF